ncbi:MAG: hypothetical protein QM541_03065 [Flavobacterium sp.]|nr:hypothetical protein [Flavobacterium sp.]
MNLLLIIVIGSAVLALVVFLTIRNKKNETDFEDNLNKNYKHPRSEEGDTNIDDLTNSVH